MKQTKKIVAIVAMVMGLMVAANQSKAQSKIGYISQEELIRAMPEMKKFDSSMTDFQNALRQQYQDMATEYTQQDSILSSKDTAKYTKAQLELKRRSLMEIRVKLQSWQQQAQQMNDQKQQELLAPIQKRALDAVQAVAKESGYTYVLAKETLLVSPPGDDILPLVKKKLNIK